MKTTKTALLVYDRRDSKLKPRVFLSLEDMLATMCGVSWIDYHGNGTRFIGVESTRQGAPGTEPTHTAIRVPIDKPLKRDD